MSTRKRSATEEVEVHEEATHEEHAHEAHHAEAVEPESLPEAEAESSLEEVSNNDMVGKIATVAVIGVGAAIISAELIPGMLIGVAAAFLPGIGPKIRPFLKSTIKAGYAAVNKTKSLVAEATEQVQDVVAEAKSEHQAATEPKSEPVHA